MNNKYAVATYQIVDSDTVPEKVSRSFQGLWIPRELWFDRNLTWIEKLFILEINSLDNEMGCFASNNYFADFFNLSSGRCSQIIKSLKNKGYISTEYIREGKQIKQRVLKILKGGIKNTKRGYLENDKGSILLSKNNNIEIYKPYFEKWNNLPSLPKHKQETVKLKIKKKHIDILKLYSEQEIISAMEAYNTLLSSDEYWYTHRFTFWRFIEKIEEFMPDMKPLENYRNKTKSKTQSFIPVQDTNSWKEQPEESLNFEGLKNAR